MAITHLSLGNSQLLVHLMTWNRLSVAEVNRNPFNALSTPPNASSRVLLRLAQDHVDRMAGIESDLLRTLEVPSQGLNGGHASLSKFHTYFEEKGPAWFRLPDYAPFALDDAWQIHAALIGAQNCLGLWRRSVAGLEDSIHVPKPRALDRHFDWLQDLFDTRVRFAQDVVATSSHGATAVRRFYDPGLRAALNMRRGAEAAIHYLGTR